MFKQSAARPAKAPIRTSRPLQDVPVANLAVVNQLLQDLMQQVAKTSPGLHRSVLVGRGEASVTSKTFRGCAREAVGNALTLKLIVDH